MSLFKSNNAFYQSDPDFSNDSEPRLREVDPYKVRTLMTGEENNLRSRQSVSPPPKSSLPPQVKVKKIVSQPTQGNPTAEDKNLNKIIEYKGIEQEDDFYFA